MIFNRSAATTCTANESTFTASNHATVASSSARAAAEDSLFLRVGEWVQVRSLAEILQTLDADPSLAGLPFMPEMAQYCGRKFRVFKSAHKTCDTIEQYTIRQMDNTVHLEDVATARRTAVVRLAA